MQPGAEPVMLLGHELWTDRYAAAPDIVGRTIRANGEQWTVIGVMPPRFAFPILEQLWVPLRVDALATSRADGPRYRVAGLLKDGVSADEAAVQLSAVATQLAQEFPETNRGVGVAVRALHRGGARHRDLRAALHDARRRHRRADDRVRERVEPADRPRVAPPARGRRAHGARRGARPDHPPAPDRGAGAGDRRRRRRRAAERRRHAVVHPGGVGEPAAVLDHLRARSPDPAVRRRPDSAVVPVRGRPAGAAGGAGDGGDGAEGRQPLVDERPPRTVQRADW